MEEQMTRKFHAAIQYDLASYKELSKANLLYSSRTKLHYLLSMFVILLLIVSYGFILQDTGFLSSLLLLYLGIVWGGRLIQAVRSKNGDLSFQRMLSTNNGVPPRNEITFTEEGIQALNLDTNGFTTTAYSQLRAIYETEHFLVLLQEHRLYSAIRKDSVTGGTVADLLDFLFQKCSHLKKKKLTSLLPGKIIQVIYVVFCILALLAALWFSHPTQALIHSCRPINNYMSYQEIANELEKLGITGIEDSLIAEMEAYDEEYDYTYSYDVGNKAMDLLCWVGMGEYDYDTWEWTPSDSGVYWFDVEVFSPETMYTDFLTGIRALDSSALDFSDITEDLSQVDLENGTGTQRVTFNWDGTSYTLEGTVDYDWFDMEVAADLADIIRARDTGSKLYFASDSGQGIFVFYGTADWKKAFEKAIGISLCDSPSAIYSFH